MPCYKPLSAWRTDSGDVVFNSKRGGKPLFLSCGQCVGCRLERSRQWATRCMHEASMHNDNCFITLTYASNDVSSLNYRDFQLFLKRLRKHWPNDRIRFYMCGEYGEKNYRPHFHACLFGFNFPDRVPLRHLGISKLYRSAQLDKLWSHGHAAIGDVTFESAAYVARYVMKKITGDTAQDHYTDPETGEILTPEFNHMSLKPGIGHDWLLKYYTDVYPTGKVVIRGHESKPPKYYDRNYKTRDPIGYDELCAIREFENYAHRDNDTYDRLATREKVAKSRIKTLKREL